MRHFHCKRSVSVLIPSFFIRKVYEFSIHGMGWDILPMFRALNTHVLALAPLAQPRPGPKRKPSIGNDYQDSIAALDRLEEVAGE